MTFTDQMKSTQVCHVGERDEINKLLLGTNAERSDKVKTIEKFLVRYSMH